MGFLKKKYQTPDYEDVGFPIKREGGSKGYYGENRDRENLRIIERHRSKENLKKKMRKDRSLGKKSDN